MPRGTRKNFKTSQRGSPAAAIGLLSLGALSMQGAQAQKLPQAGTVVSGQAAIGSPSGSNLTVTQGSQRAVIDWNGFSVGQNNRVDFVQPNSSAAILNRVTGSASSTIAGQVTGNGQVYLINPNGIAITPTGAVQVGGSFIASTLDISNSDFNAGKLNFVGQGASAGVSNAGTITSAPRGFVGLVGGTVSNNGIINVPLGKVGLASGEQVTIDPTGDGFLQVAVPTGAAAADGRALIDVGGRISARGGSIAIKAATAQQAVRDAINVTGVLSARTASGRNGDIVLGGGAGGNVVVTGQVKATGSKRGQNGGSIAVTGNTIVLRGAIVDASGRAGGGTIEIGGGRQGRGPLQHAVNTRIDQTSMIRADATDSGNGGNVTVWSDGSTAFAGGISARGGPNGGNGGQVEVSSHGILEYTGLVDTLSPDGKVGKLLLDPYDLTIQTAPGTPLAACSSGSCTPSGSGSILTVATLQAALLTSDVTVSTGSSGSDAGNISVNNAVTWSSGFGLTLSAAGSIAVASGASITATGAGSLTLNAGTGSITVDNATLSTNGGNLNISAPGSGTANAIYFSDATLSVGTGTGTIGGTSTSGVGLLFGGANSISSSGAGSISLAGTSDSSNGVFLLSGASLNTSGSVSIAGSSGSGSSVYFSGSNTVTDSAGNLSITGANSSYRGVEFLNANTLANNGSGTMTISGNTTSNNVDDAGLEFNGSSTLSTSGNIALTGSSQTTPAVAFGSNNVTASSGNLSFAGTSSSGPGVSFYQTNTFSNNGSGTVSLNGISGSGTGIVLYGPSSVTTAGTVTLSGTSSSNSGILFSSDSSVTASSGSLGVEGYSSSGYGLQFTGTNVLINGGAASMTLGGTSSSGAGTIFSGSENLATLGDISLSGISNSFIGFYLAGANTLTTYGGALSIYGISTNNAGILLAGQENLTNSGGTLSFNGTSGTYRGLDFYDSDNVTFSGDAALRGTATSGLGVNFQRSTVTNSSGNLTIDTTSGTGAGASFNGNNSFVNSGSERRV